MAGRYVPAPGDIVWLNFDPRTGHEQSGHRPALVLSAEAYNRRTGLMVCCPLTTRIKGFPFEVLVAGKPPSAVLSDAIRSVDWRARGAKRKGKVSPTELAEVRAKITALIGA
jgi:mRNA interferase MazF